MMSFTRNISVGRSVCRLATAAAALGALFVAGLSPASACVAVISDLSGGNVAYNRISGTNVWVRMYVYNSQPNCTHAVKVYLGGSVLAENPAHVKVSPYYSQWNFLRTDATGKWQSEGNKGYVKFDTTHMIRDGSHSYLRVWVYPFGLTAFFSNSLDDNKDGTPDNIELYNKAYVLSDTNDINKATADKVYDHCWNMNHNIQPGKGASRTFPSKWGPDGVLQNLKYYTVFYIAAHGQFVSGQTYFDDPAAGYNWISSSEVAGYVSQKAGLIPYYNIVHIDACYTCMGFDMAHAFDIVTSIGGKQPDRAYIGWLDYVYGNQTAKNWTDHLWGCLVNRSTVGDAKHQADTAYPGVAGSGELEGDKNTTLHSVYSGTMG